MLPRLEGNALTEVRDQQVQALVPEARQVLPGSGDEIVEDVDLVPAGEKGFDEVGTDEAGSAGHQTAHGATLSPQPLGEGPW